MRSIRLSLVVYFVTLVVAGLGVASYLVYEVAQRTLRDKEHAAGELIDTSYKERCQEAHTQLDERLLSQARTLAGQVRPRFRPMREILFHLNILGMMTSSVGPNAHTIVPHMLHLTQGHQYRRRGWPSLSPLQFQLWHHDMIELGFGEEVEVPEDHRLPRLSYRIQTNNWGNAIPNRGGLNLPDEADFAPNERLTWTFDDCILPDRGPVRRIRFRSLIALQEGGGPPPGPPSSRNFYQAPRPAIIIQCAASTSDLEASLEPYQRQRDEDHKRIRTETEETIARLQKWLLLITGLTLAATTLGSIGLVWLGLRPLRRLGEAVSKLSPRNFQLLMEPQRMPVELQPIADRLRTSLDQLRRAFHREKQATADISHELRTPLAAMLTTLELALRKPRSLDQYREMLQDCLGSARHMHQIVERLLTLARLDAGVDRLRAQMINPLELAEQCVSAVRPLATARGLQVHLKAGTPDGAASLEETARLLTDPDKLREVLNNLLHNAIQYNRPAGCIDLVVTPCGEEMQFEVRDTGIGIPPEARDRIFERFYRADPARAGDGLNAGLGLAIVKEYVELMGGHISVESAPGKGSTFLVQLPVQGPAAAA
ncbi:MAG: HAMP domain-containing sensor histidine kinase [Gemmataceae bacterium]